MVHTECLTEGGTRVPVVCPVMPYPALGGGHKRTLRLLEALERAGGVPHVLTTDPRPDGAEVLRERGWAVDILDEPTPSPVGRMRQHLCRLPNGCRITRTWSSWVSTTIRPTPTECCASCAKDGRSSLPRGRARACGWPEKEWARSCAARWRRASGWRPSASWTISAQNLSAAGS